MEEIGRGFKLSKNFPGVTEENHEKFHQIKLPPDPESNTGISEEATGVGKMYRFCVFDTESKIIYY
jgi:hypothetical protein